MPESLDGIPLHPLVVHAVVVLVPLAALGVIALAVVPKWRARFGVVVMGLAVVALLFVPVAKESGEQLEETLGETDLIERHAELGDQALLGTVPLVVVAVLLWWMGRRAQQGRPLPSWTGWLVPVVGVVVALGAMAQVFLIGHSGAKAVWG
jgi:uncharacterized membrane protein